MNSRLSCSVTGSFRVTGAATSNSRLLPVPTVWIQGHGIENLLAYRTAQLAKLLMYAVLPILGLALAVLAWISEVFDWRINAGLNYFYSELKFLENETARVATKSPIALKIFWENWTALSKKSWR